MPRASHRRRWSSQDLRIVYRVDLDAILIAEVFAKKTQKTPTAVIDKAKRRLRMYDDVVKE